MKRKSIIIILLILVSIIGIFAWWNEQLPNLREMCVISNGGWAPAFMNSGELSTCDGKPLATDSPLIDYEGYTCYCHTPNTCWNGKECVEITK